MENKRTITLKGSVGVNNNESNAEILPPAIRYKVKFDKCDYLIYIDTGIANGFFFKKPITKEYCNSESLLKNGFFIYSSEINIPESNRIIKLIEIKEKDVTVTITLYDEVIINFEHENILILNPLV